MKQAGFVLAFIAVAALMFSSCMAGPYQLFRSADDWDQKLYVESPLLDGVLTLVQVIPLVKFVAAAVDVLVTNAYFFWLQDLWDGKGTAFEHFQPKATDGSLKSLGFKDGKWFSVTK